MIAWIMAVVDVKVVSPGSIHALAAVVLPLGATCRLLRERDAGPEVR